MASPDDSDGAPQAAGLQASGSTSGSRDITMSCQLQNATSLTMRELQEITDSFSKERAIGEGAYGKVYRGTLDNGEEIAVKLLHNRIESDDGQFRREFENLMRLEHRNIVRLVGYCYETQHKPMIYAGQTIFAEEISKALCFEYMQNGSLEKHLSEEHDGLDWHTRYKIIKGTCDGLQYLHEGFKEPIYHLDLKPDNILLDENMVPKLADFGLSRLFGGQQTMMTQSTLGTIGYMPLEYLFGNIISNKFDIFSLGVVMTKIIAGPNGHTKRAEMPYQEFLDQVEQHWRNRLKATWTSPEPLEAHCEQVSICTKIALSCMEMDRHERPNITDIIHQLNDTEAAIDKALSSSASSHSWMQGDMVNLKAFTRCEAIPDAETCNNFPILVQVTSPPWCRAHEVLRAGVDVVTVLNVNRTVLIKRRVHIIKEAVMIVIDKLGPKDRLSILSLEDNKIRVMRLTFMTNKGRDDARLRVNELKGNCGMGAGAIILREGVKILRSREVEEDDSRIGCIMYLSNGDDKEILTDEISSEFPVHTFGLGEQHSPEVMKYIADRTFGTYSFVNHYQSNEIKDAFKLFINGITKVAATSVKITINTHEGVVIGDIMSGSYANSRSNMGQSGDIHINDIYAGERKNIIIYLRVANGKKKLVTLGGQYQISKENKQLADLDVFVLRPRSACSPGKLTIHSKVAAELTRIELAKELSKIDGRISRIHLEVIWDKIRRSDEGHAAPEETLSGLGNELAEMMKNVTSYQCHFNQIPYAISWLSCHKWQRATTKGSFYDSGAFTLMRMHGEDDDA